MVDDEQCMTGGSEVVPDPQEAVEVPGQQRRRRVDHGVLVAPRVDQVPIILPEAQPKVFETS